MSLHRMSTAATSPSITGLDRLLFGSAAAAIVASINLDHVGHVYGFSLVAIFGLGAILLILLVRLLVESLLLLVFFHVLLKLPLIIFVEL